MVGTPGEDFCGRYSPQSHKDRFVAEAIDLGLRRCISKHGRFEWQRRRNGEGKVVVLVCRNMKGEAAIYRTERGEKANRLPRFTRPLRRVMSPPSEDLAHAISSRALKGHAG